MSGAHFNGLTPAEDERLSILAEECGEVVVAVEKIKRHGYASQDPTVPGSLTNRQALELELGHVQAALEGLQRAGDVRENAVHASHANKAATANRWTHHQPDSRLPSSRGDGK